MDSEYLPDSSSSLRNVTVSSDRVFMLFKVFLSLFRRCTQNTHSHDTFVHVQRITERTAQVFQKRNTRGSRIAHCSVSKTTCLPSVMSHMLPHLPQNTSTRSLSPTSPVFRPYSPSLSCPTSAHSELDYETLRDPRRSGRYTKSASPTEDASRYSCMTVAS